jgi:hypothetical protein
VEEEASVEPDDSEDEPSRVENPTKAETEDEETR